MPETIDDSNAGPFVEIKTNVARPSPILSPEEEQKTFTLPEGYEINLFASEVEFPDLKKPVAMTFDAKGRLWVTTMPSYPMYLPGKAPDDKVLIFEDSDDDGQADRQTVFADRLHIPGGLDLGDGGAYVAQQPGLMFLKDTDGDDKADVRERILHGFDTADSHHALSAFTWDPAGGLYFQEGTFHHTSVETPYGPVRDHDAAVFRFEPRTWKFDVFVSYPFANPWGHYVDRWGQNFVADASPGANYYGTAFSGQVDYPDKHGAMKQFLVKQWRPTCGCEIVASRHFPDDTQGDYLLNNTIGFQGILRYRMHEEGSGFAADPVEPLLRSSDPSFRPVDLEFGPDGSLYVVDWYNPLIGHMQHNLRDPNRDVRHGRIWRITAKGRPLVAEAKIADASIPELARPPQDLRGPHPRTRPPRTPHPRREGRPLRGFVLARQAEPDRSRLLAPRPRNPLAPPEPRRRQQRPPPDRPHRPRAQGPRRRHPRPLLLARSRPESPGTPPRADQRRPPPRPPRSPPRPAASSAARTPPRPRRSPWSPCSTRRITTSNTR